MKNFERPKRNKSKAKRQLEKRIIYANLEIDRIYGELQDDLASLEGNGNGGTLYARESSKHQDSVPAQVRSMLKHVIAKGIYVAREHIFFDIAIRGAQKQR